MKKIERNPRWINLMVRIVGRRQMSDLRIASRNPKLASELTLRHILDYAKDTEYGRDHHFDEILQARSHEELLERFHKEVHPNNYEDFSPYIERQKTGVPNVIVPDKPIMYATTSGTTAKPKWIPITERYLKSVYQKMTHAWLYNFTRHRRATFGGYIVFVVGKDVEGYAPDGTIYGSVSSVLQNNGPSFVKKMYASVPDIFSITDYPSRNYTLMRMCIEKDVSLLIMPNPSTLLELQNTVNDHLDEFIEDIQNGTLSAKIDVPDDIRLKLAPRMHPNPERAAELRHLKEQYGTVLPKHYWPNLQVLSTWKCGNTQIYIDKLDGFFGPEVFYQELGYFSTECRFGLVFDDTLNSRLFPHMHFYEFVEEHDLDNPNPRFYQIYELEEGKRYCSFVTTFAGLYRYNMNDLIEVGPRYWRTPTVHMVQKINGIVSMTGEKLAECQLVQAVREAEAKTKLKTRFFVGFADLESSAYHFFYEFANRSVTQPQAEAFTRQVDELLMKENIEYESKRHSGRLHDPQTGRLVEHAYLKFKDSCVKDGMRAAQFKLNLLLQDDYRFNKFKTLLVPNKDAAKAHEQNEEPEK